MESLPGVGRKTTNVVLANLFNEDCIAVDTHVSRVSKRLKLSNITDDVLTIEKKLNKKFKKKGTKIKTVKKSTAAKLTVKKLKAGKKYYVRIRTYKTINGTNYYSAWSKSKSVKTKA